MQIGRPLFYAVSTFVKSDEGVSVVEFALAGSLIAIVIIVAVQLIGTNLNLTFGTVAAAL